MIENELVHVGVCLPLLHYSVSISDFDCLTVGRLVSETQTPRLIYERKDLQGLREERKHTSACTNTHTHRYHSVMLEIHRNHMSLTLFIILPMLQWKWPVACISLMNLTPVRHVYTTWMKGSTCTLTHWHKCINTSYLKVVMFILFNYVLMCLHTATRLNGGLKGLNWPSIKVTEAY